MGATSSNPEDKLLHTTKLCPAHQRARSYHLTPETCRPRTQKPKLRSLQADLLNTPANLLFYRPRRRPICSLLRSFDALIRAASSLLRLLTLLFRFLGCSLFRLFFLSLACLLTAKLFAPFLLLLWLNLVEEVAGGTDLVSDGKGAGFP